MTSGTILAGGRSTRFEDVDKSVAELGGVPLIRRVANRLTGTDDSISPGAARASRGDPVVDELVINCRPDQQDAIATALDGVPLPVRWAFDDTSDLGPVAGIRNACRVASNEYTVVVACDMPFVDPEFLASLIDDAAGREAAIPRLDDKWLQTTHAVYHANAMATACDRALARGDRKLLAPLDELDRVIVDGDTVRDRTSKRTFLNINTRDELATAEAILADAGSDH